MEVRSGETPGSLVARLPAVGEILSVEAERRSPCEGASDWLPSFDVRSNGGARGVDGLTLAHVEETGVLALLESIAAELRWMFISKAGQPGSLYLFRIEGQTNALDSGWPRSTG